MDLSGEPFGDSLFDGITDWDEHRRATIRLCILGLDTARNRAEARVRRINDYTGGPISWAPEHQAEAA